MLLIKGGKFHEKQATAEVSVIAAGISATLDEFSGMEAEVSGTAPEVSGTTPEVSGMAAEVSGTPAEVSGMNAEVSGMAAEVSVSTPFSGFQAKLSLNTLPLVRD